MAANDTGAINAGQVGVALTARTCMNIPCKDRADSARFSRIPADKSEPFLIVRVQGWAVRGGNE
jgi:hypothetical protein